MGFLDKARGKLGVIPSTRRTEVKEMLREGVSEWRSLPAWKKKIVVENLKEGVKSGVARWRSLPAWQKERIKENVREKVDAVLEK